MTEQPIQVPTYEEVKQTMEELESRVHFQGEEEQEQASNEGV